MALTSFEALESAGNSYIKKESKFEKQHAAEKNQHGRLEHEPIGSIFFV